MINNKLNRIHSHILLIVAIIGFSNIYAQTDIISLRSQPMNLSQIPLSADIDKSKAVGAIPIEYSQGALGAVTYTVPIEIYPGKNGLQPNLSLVYNSISGNGIAGTGWNIGGLSAISRTNSSIYYDGKTEPTSTYSNKFSLDGNRLLLTSTILKDSSIYQTEQGNVKVKELRRYVYDPATQLQQLMTGYFEVYYSNGTIATYGYKQNIDPSYINEYDQSKYDFNIDNYKLSYPLTSIEDTNGNNVEYIYAHTRGQQILLKIIYGGTKSDKKRNLSVKFTYEDRPDTNSLWTAGIEQTLSARLQKIESFFETQLLRTYILSYENAEYSQLNKIDCKAGNEQMNPLQFYYGEKNTPELIVQDKTLGYYDKGNGEEDVHIISAKFKNTALNNGLIIYPNDFTYRPDQYNTIYSSYYETDTAYIYDDILTSLPKKLNLGQTHYDNNKFYDLSQFRGLHTMDIDGSGNDKIVKIYSHVGYDAKYETLIFEVYDENLSQISSFHIDVGDVVYYKSEKGTKTWNAMGKHFLTGDFEGTGKTTMLIISHSKDYLGKDHTPKAIIVDINEKKIIRQQDLRFDVLPDDILMAVDHNGDGKSELCLINDNGLHFYNVFDYSRLNPTPLSTKITKSDIINERRKLLIGDINGDGKVDYLLSPLRNQQITKTEYTHHGPCNGCCTAYNRVKLGTSADETIITYGCGNRPSDTYCTILNDGGKQVTYDLPGASTWTSLISKSDYSGFVESQLEIIKHATGNKYFLQDIDGDGLVDLILKNEAGTVSVFANQNGKISKQQFYNDLTLDKDYQLAQVNIYDNRNSSTIQLLALKDQSLKIIQSSVNKARSSLLTGVINSLGIVSKHNYTSLLNPTVYKEGAKSVFPYIKFNGDMNVIQNVSTYFNNTKVASNSYTYTGSVIHRQGLGFRGFESTTVTDDIRDITVTQTFDPLNFGILKTTDSPTASATYSYSVSVAENKIATVTLNNKSEKDKLKDVSITTTYSNYDTYGNAQTEVVDYGNAIKTTISKKYKNLTTIPYILGQLSEQSITNERGGKSIITKNTYLYNTKGQPISQRSYYAGNLTVVDSMTYYTTGEIQKKLTKGYDSKNWLTTEYTYDTYGRVTNETDPLGFTTTYGYNNKGQLYSVKNHKGHETKYEYDIWGRKNKTTYPDLVVESSSMAWEQVQANSILYKPGQENIALTTPLTKGETITGCKSVSLKPGFSFAANNGNSMNIKIDINSCNPLQGANDIAYIVTTTIVTGKPTTKVYTDGLGREIRTAEMRMDGKYLFIDKKYDAKGRLEKVSLPFKGASSVQWNTYTYDTYDRITSLTYASGKKDSYAYNKNTVTETKENVTRRTTYDATGKIVTIVDPAGTITYTIRPDGQSSSIKAPGDIVTSFDYDKYGRQNKIVDPSAGTKTFVMDDANGIYTETDARGKVTKITYDKYNRVATKEIVGESITNYAYNADGLASGVITKNTAGTLLSEKTYNYDNLLRLYTEKEMTVDDKWLQKTFVYSAGNTSSILYEANTGTIVTQNYAYSNGHMSEIKLNNTTSIWKLTQENDMGLAIGATTGILTRTYGYDAYGLPTARIIKNGSTAIQNFEYDFNATTGNLNWRKDNNRNIQENFLYDELNRLTHFGGKKMMSYDIKGNITDYAGVGKFDYTNTAKPYAVTEISPYGTEIPLPNQTITYNGMMRPSSITEDIYRADFIYDTGADRVRMQVKKNNTVDLTRYYIGGQYEFETGVAGTKEKLYLGGDAYSAAAVYVKEGTGAWQIYYIGRDYLGSITHIIDAAGAIKQELSYDPWGRLRNAVNQELYAIGNEPALFLARGYTGHEHLPMFGLINMNARLYDPVIGRFLSPDPYVQAPDWSQNFNRFSYALNNPLRFNDPSGEFIPFLIVAGIGFAVGYTTHGLTTGDWGWSAVVAGGIGAGMSAAGFALSGVAITAASALKFSGQMVANQLLSNIIPPIDMSIGNFTIGISPIAMFTGGVNNIAKAFQFGAGINASYKIGDWTLAAGVTGNGFKPGNYYGGFSYDDGKNGFSYMATKYNQGDQQVTATVGLRSGDFSVQHENDLFAKSLGVGGHDRYRTAAFEATYKNYSIGTTIYTTDRGTSYGGYYQLMEYEGSKGKYYYDAGQQLASTLYVGVKKGNRVNRIGLNDPAFGWFQNGLIHGSMGMPRFQEGDYSSAFMQSGTYNQSSLYFF